MAPSFDSKIWPVLGGFCNSQQTRVEWFSTLGPVAFQRIPLLKVPGERVDFIRCPETGIRLEPYENWDGSFSALPPADTEIDSRIDGLTLEDLLVYELDWPRILQEVQSTHNLSGPIRCLDYNPLLWHLGQSDGIPYYFAVLNSATALAGTLEYLQSAPQSRLLLPSVSDPVFAALLKNSIQHHALDSNTAPVFAPEDQQEALPYRIRSMGVGYKIVYDGQEATTGNWGGMRFVEFLLKNPPTQPIHVTRLEAAVASVSTHFSGLEDVVDPESDQLISVGREAVLQERSLGIDDRESETELWKLLQKQKAVCADPTADPKAQELAAEQVTAIEAYLGDSLSQEKSSAGKAYDRVRNSLNRLLKSLRGFRDKDGNSVSVFIQFAEHLDEYLLKPSRRYSGQRNARTKAEVAQTFTYEPPPDLIWSD